MFVDFYVPEDPTGPCVERHQMRVDRTEDPLDPGVNFWSYNPYLTFRQSEFVRLRAQLQLLRGDDTLDDTERFFLQATFSAGPHKHEAY